MSFTNLKLSNWRQFATIDLNFESRMTIITGANGSGKTTILNILAKHNNWNYTPLASPRESGDGKWGFFTNISSALQKLIKNQPAKTPRVIIGEITYADQSSAEIALPTELGQNSQYNISIEKQRNIPLLYIPSHRPIFKYHKISSIPVNKKTAKQAAEEVANTTRERYFGNGEGANQIHMIKNALIGWAINGYGVQNNGRYIMPPDNEQISYFEGFQSILRLLLPKSIGFEKLEIRNMEIIIVGNEGQDDFMLEAVSGGIGAIIDLAWQVFMFSKDKTDSFHVLIDEVENHLHPSMQRRVLSDLLTAFPKANFIVSTHSPLIVNSVKDARIYILSYKDKKIESNLLDINASSLEANEILEDVLGVTTTLPIFTEENIKAILQKYKSVPIDDRVLDDFRKDLKAIGMEKLIAKYLLEII